MRKLSEKIGSCLIGDNAFLNRFKSCVYNLETPFEFEQEWQNIITDFGCKLMHGCHNCMIFEKCGYLPILEMCF